MCDAKKCIDVFRQTGRELAIFSKEGMKITYRSVSEVVKGYARLTPVSTPEISLSCISST